MISSIRVNSSRVLPLLLAALLLIACTGNEIVQPVVSEATLPAASETPQSVAPSTAKQTVEQAAEQATELPTLEPTPAEILPIEVAYFTPSQGEGPYYPVDKLADRDNDLVALAGAAGTPTGEVLEFGGKLYDSTGMPVAGAVIEIWQTDANGVYLHPNDPGTSRRDMSFQFYGESVTAKDGSYSFRTLYPGHYEPRPRHIHVKVKLDGRELLTTQFYFDNDPALASDSLFASATGDQLALIMAVQEANDEAGNPILMGTRDVVLRDVLSKP